MLSCPSMACMARRLAPPSSKWVAKVWRKVCGEIFFVNAGAFSIHLQIVEHGDARQMFSATVRHEHVVLLAGLCLDMAAVGKPEFQLGNGLRRNGHKTLFRTLARDTHKALVEKQVADFQRAEFAHPQSAAVKHLDNGAVALPLGLRQVDSRFRAFHFVERQHLGQMFGFAR